MKTGSKISIIATLSTLALVGTAFAAWEFNKEAEQAAQSNVAITKDASVGELVLDPETFYLTLDQQVLSFTEADHSNSDAAISDQITTIDLEYTGSAKSNDVSDVTLKAEYSVDSAIATYVTVSGGAMGAQTNNANKATATYTLPSLAWVDGKKPTTQAQFDAMKTALAGAKISFTFTAEIAE